MPNKFVNVEMKELEKVSDTIRAFQFLGIYTDASKSVKYNYPMMADLENQYLCMGCMITNEKGDLLEKVLMQTGKRFVMLEQGDWVAIAKDKQGGIKIKVMSSDDMNKYREAPRECGLFDGDDSHDENTVIPLLESQIQYEDEPISEEQAEANINFMSTEDCVQTMEVLQCPYCESIGGGVESHDSGHLECMVCKNLVDYSAEDVMLKTPTRRAVVNDEVITVEVIPNDSKEEGSEMF